MKTFKNQVSNGNFIASCVCIFTLIISGSLSFLMGQTPVENALKWTVNGSASNPGDHLSLDLELFPEALSGNKVTGFDIYFYLSADVKLPEFPDLDCQGSWMITDPETELTLEVSITEQKVRLKASLNSAKLGNGKFIRIELTTLAGLIDPSRAVEHGGGIIMIENIGFKQADQFAGDAVAPPQGYPNPCSEKLNLDWGIGKGQTAALYDMQGKMVATIAQNDESLTVMDLTGVDAGTYQLVFRDGAQRAQCQRILVR